MTLAKDFLIHGVLRQGYLDTNKEIMSFWEMVGLVAAGNLHWAFHFDLLDNDNVNDLIVSVFRSPCEGPDAVSARF